MSPEEEIEAARRRGTPLIQPPAMTAAARAERRAIRLLYAAAALAPWFVGARPVFGGVWWVFAGLLAGAFGMLMASPGPRRGVRRLPGFVLWPVGGLLACLGWWAAEPEPHFLTRFASEQWTAVETWSPGAFLNLPPGARLVFLASLLLGLVAAAWLGRREDFRRGLSLAIGWSAVAVALYSQAERWIDLPAPAWTIISGGDERFNAGFLHYSTMAAALNIGWPLLLFPIWKVRTFASAGRALALGLFATALAFATIPFAKASSAGAVAIGLLAAGAVWGLFGQLPFVRRNLVLAALATLFFAVGAWQIWSIGEVERNFPDGWRGVEATLDDAPSRDAGFRAIARTRNDHLVGSLAPASPSAMIAAGRMIADHPLFGPGPGSWPKRLAVYSNDPTLNTFSLAMQFTFHDALQTGAEWGLVPLFAWLTLWAAAFFSLAVCPRNRGLPPPGLLLALLGVALHSLVHFSLEIPAIQIWTALLLGLALAPRVVKPVPRLRLPRRRIPRSSAPAPVHP